MTLPTPRLLLTSLINTLTSSPSPTTNVAPAQSGINRPYSAQLQKEETPSNSNSNSNSNNNNNNPLKALDREQKALLSTLHVLLPPPMLLQALDLLDRGLVIRVIEHEHHDPHEKPPPSSQSITRDTETEPLAHPPPPPQQADDNDDAHLPAQPPASSSSSSPGRRSPKAGSATAIRKRNQFFQVRSSQQPHPRKRRSRDPLSSAAAAATTTGSKTYIVRLTSWICSCAAFTFSSYPSSLGGPNSPSCSAPWAVLGGGEGRAESLGGLRDGSEGEGWWEFGGLSYDGVVGEGAGGSVPVCKHLLACLLGEKWDVLRGYVKERAVNREEMAGLAGE